MGDVMIMKRAMFLGVAVLSVAGCQSGAIVGEKHGVLAEAVEMKLLQGPPVVAKCELDALDDLVKRERYYLAFDLDGDGVPEYFIESYMGAHSISFVLVDSKGNVLTAPSEFIAEMGPERIVILNSKHHGYYDIVGSYSDPDGVHAIKWEFTGTKYVQVRAFDYARKFRSDAAAFIESVPGAVKAYWYCDWLAAPPWYENGLYKRYQETNSWNDTSVMGLENSR